MIGDKPHTQIISHHQGHGGMLLTAEIVLEKLSMSRKNELIRLDIALVDRRRHHSVNQFVLQITTGSIQSPLRHLSGNFGRSAQIQLHLLFIQIDEIRPFCRKLLDGFGELERKIRQFHIFFVIGSHLRKSIYHRSTHLHYPIVTQRFDNHLIADTVDIALRNANCEILIFSHIHCFFQTAKISIFSHLWNMAEIHFF